MSLAVSIVGSTLLAMSSVLAFSGMTRTSPFQRRYHHSLHAPPPSAATAEAEEAEAEAEAELAALAASDLAELDVGRSSKPADPIAAPAPRLATAVLPTARAAPRPPQDLEDIHRPFGQILRPWRRSNATAIGLSPDDGLIFEYAPQQLFAPNVHTEEHLRRDAQAGCLVGSGQPFVLPVSPWHFAAPHREGMRAFNPSIVRFGQTGYLVSYRVDYQSGCVVQRHGMRKQYHVRTGAKHSCVVRTDGQLRALGQARVLDACGRTVEEDSTADLDPGTNLVDVRLARSSHFQVPEGVVGVDKIWLTYMPLSSSFSAISSRCQQCCMRCNKQSHVGRLHVLSDSLDGSAGSWRVRIADNTPLCTGILAGRNHALFFAPDGQVRLQSWLHPRIVVTALPSAAAELRLMESPSLQLFRAGAQAVEKCHHVRLSGTSSLVRVRARKRDALLGVGHIHHGRESNLTHNNPEDLRKIRRGVAYFGSHYMHFFYLLDANPPHSLLAHSAEWCLPHSPTIGSCEVVQFVSGLELAHGGEDVLLMYGVNDCESKAARMPLGRLLRLLQWDVP